MYSELFDALGGASGAGGNPSGSTSNRNSNNSNTDENNPPALSFKAGKMELALQENGNFWATPNTLRCQVNLKYGEDSQLEWEWFDRREKKVIDTIRITDPVVLKRVDVPKSQDADHTDRVYCWKLDSEWRMIWLQDKEEDPELIDKANEILKVTRKPEETAVAPTINTNSSSGRASDLVSARGSPGNVSTSSVSTTTRQVDALSSILENLGMPQGGGASSSGEGGVGSLAAATAVAAPAASSTGGGGGGGVLTLADLRNAMGGMTQQQVSSSNALALSEIVTSEAISSLLADEDVRKRLLEQLPEEQRSEEFLEENLRSPQIQQTLRALTAALLPDDHGSMDGYHSVLANFQLDAADGQRALSTGQSPIQAFLDCVLASVEKEKAQAGHEDSMGEEEAKHEEDDEDAEMKDE